MSLLVWLPLNGNVINQGTASLTFSSLSGSTLTSDGKVTSQCYNNTSYSSGGYVSNETITLGQNQSICAWVKFTELTSSSSLGGSIAGQHRYPNNVGMGMTIKYVSSTTGYLSVNTGNGSSRTFNTYCGSTLLQANTWYHLCYTYDGSTIRLYVNGNLDGTHSYSSMSTPADYFMVGCWSFSSSSGNGVYGGYKLYGYINDLRVYNHTLSTKEIKDLAKGLLLHYKFNFEDLYESVEYIESNGSQYINTDYTPNSTSRVEAVLYTNDTRNRNWFGANIGSNGYVFNSYNASSIEYLFGNSGWVTKSASTLGSKFTLSFGIDGISINGTSINATMPQTSFTCSSVLSIFIRYGGSAIINGRVYSMKIYEGTKLVRNLIPCIRRLDVKPGLYDLITNKFYTNSGSSEFIYPGTISTQQLLDSSGMRNNTTDKANVGISTDTPIGNNSIIFNGSSTYVDTNIPLTSVMTFVTWMRFNSTSNCHVIDCRATSGETGYQPIYAGTSYGLQFYCSGSSSNQWSSSECGFTTNIWYHIAITVDPDGGELWINGVSKGRKTAGKGTNYGTRLMRLGARCTKANWFDGQIADLQVYASALSEANIKELYQAKHIIDKNNNFYSNSVNELNENISSTTLDKKSILNTKLLTENITLEDGSTWAPILAHYVPNGIFASSGNFSTLEYEANNRWSNFGLIKFATRPESGYYEFLVKHQTDVDGSFSIYRWKQTVNPFSAAWADVNPSVVGSKVIRISPTSSNSGGMYWMNASNCKMCFANNSNGNWYGTGICSNYNGGIPSYNNETAKGWQLVYMRVSKNNTKIYKGGMINTTSLKEI